MTVDIVMLTAEIACKAYEDGQLSREKLTRTIEKCINVTSIQNGDAAKYGLPFPDTKFDISDLDNDKETK